MEETERRKIYELLNLAWANHPYGEHNLLDEHKQKVMKEKVDSLIKSQGFEPYKKLG